MSTAYTSLLGLALPATGELSGTWGDTVNNYITTYLDAAVAGNLDVILTGNVTLTKTTNSSLGATSSQYAILNVSPSASTWTITAPAASKSYIVVNLSPTYTFVLKATGQTGVTIGTSEKCIVAFNGTDFVKIASTVPLPAGNNTYVQYNNNGVLAGGSGLTFDGTTLVASQIKNNGLAQGRVTYAGSSSQLVDSTNLTFDGTNLAVGAAGNPTASKGQLQVGAALSYTDTGLLGAFSSNTAGYNQVIVQNTNSGAASSANLIVSNDLGTASTYYAEVGMNSSGFTGTGSLNLPNMAYFAAASGDVTFGTYASASIHFVVNNGAADALTINASSQLVLPGGTVNGVPYLNASKIITTGSAFSYDGSFVTVPGLKNGGLTSGRITYATTSGQLTDASGFTFDGSFVTVPGLKNSGLTAGRITYATTNGQLTDASALTYDGTYLTVGGIKNGGLTSGRITYATTNGQLTDSAGLTFNGTDFTTTGSATATGFIPSGSTVVANGMYLSAANTVSFATNTTRRLSITSAGYTQPVAYADTVVALGNSGTATTITLTSGNVFTATLTGNCTFTLSAPIATGATSFTLILTNDGTAGRTVAWSGGTFLFPNGSASLARTTTANATDIWVFFSPNGGTTWYGNVAMKNMSA
jgi:hypothetical protein